MLDEGDDMREVVLAGVLTVDDCSHGGRARERQIQRKNDLYTGPCLGYDLVSDACLLPSGSAN